MNNPYWTIQQSLADLAIAQDAAAKHDLKQAYFKWRDSLTWDETDGYARYAEDDREYRTLAGITDEEEQAHDRMLMEREQEAIAW